MALSFIPIGPYADGDPVDEATLANWDNNTQWLKFAADTARYMVIIEDEQRNNDIVVNQDRDWRGLLLTIDGYAYSHGKVNEPNRFMPGGSKDHRLATGLDLSAANHGSHGMFFYTATGGAAYNSANMPRGEWRLVTFPDTSAMDFFVWVRSSDGALMGRLQPSGGFAAISDYRQLNALMIVRARDDII